MCSLLLRRLRSTLPGHPIRPRRGGQLLAQAVASSLAACSRAAHWRQRGSAIGASRGPQADASLTLPGAQAIVIELMREWQKSLAAGIRAMQRNGHLPLSLNVDEAAAALLAGIQGGVSIMLSTGQSTHLRAALDWLLCAWRTVHAGRLRAAQSRYAPSTHDDLARSPPSVA
jgi:hypothetical protein